MNENKINYLDPNAVARLGSLSLAARTVVEGFISGLHQSPFKGFSLEFSQHRQYSPGDELRHIDWKVYARSDRYVVRQYEEETNMRCYIVIDASASMGFKYAAGLTKISYACYLAASLAYLMLKQQDSVGLVTLDRTVQKILPPRSVKGHLNHILEILEHIKTSPTQEISPALNDLGRRIQKRHLIVIISDLLGNQDDMLKAIKYFHFHKHEVIVLQVMDPAERSMPFKGPVMFEGMEDEDIFQTEPEAIKHDYRRLLEDFLNTYHRGFRQADIDYCLMETSQPFDRALGNYLTKRQMIR